MLFCVDVDPCRHPLDARSTRQRWCIVSGAGPGVVGGQMLPGTAVAAPRSRSHLHAQAGGRADCRVRNRGRLLKRSGSRSGRAKGPPTLSTSLFSSPTSPLILSPHCPACLVVIPASPMPAEHSATALHDLSQPDSVQSQVKLCFACCRPLVPEPAGAPFVVHDSSDATVFAFY